MSVDEGASMRNDRSGSAKADATSSAVAEPRANEGVKRVAVLNTRYPALSHTFIEREIRAIRAKGLEVLTVSVRMPDEADCLCDSNRNARAETEYLLGSKWKLVLAALWCAATRPLRFLAGLIAAQKLSLDGMKFRLLHLAYWIEAARLVRILRQRGIRHVHVHMANNGAAVAMIACAIDPALSYSLTIHGSTELINMGLHRLADKAHGAVFVRCISNFCRAQVMIAMQTLDMRKLHVVHCGVDPMRFAPRPPLPDGPLRLLTVGRFDPIKGYGVLLEAIRQLRDRGVDVKLTMVGDGPTLRETRQLAEALGVAERVTFTGAVGQDHIREHYAGADALVISSFMEGIPVVLMEAMAMELAVVSTNVAGIPELITHGEHGLLCEAGSAEKLAAAIEHLANDRSLISRMGRAGRERIIRDFNIATIGVDVAVLLEGVVRSETDWAGGKQSMALAN